MKPILTAHLLPVIEDRLLELLRSLTRAEWALQNGWTQVESEGRRGAPARHTTSRGRQLAEVTMPQDIAWRVFTKGIDRAAAEPRSTITGDRALGFHVLGMTAIIG